MVEKITEKNIDRTEKETIQIASSTLSALESALAAWEAAKEKPEDFEEKFRKYEWLRERLADWMTRMLKARDNGDDLKARQKRLSEFVAILKEYQRGQDG
jgi:hypothetical protein